MCSSPKKVVRGNVLNAAKQKAQEHAEPADAKQEEAMGE